MTKVKKTYRINESLLCEFEFHASCNDMNMTEAVEAAMRGFIEDHPILTDEESAEIAAELGWTSHTESHTQSRTDSHTSHTESHTAERYIDTLEKQLAVKDEQIANLNQALLNAQQQGTNAQALHGMDKAPALLEADVIQAPVKPSIGDRIRQALGMQTRKDQE